jgi:hypothetical protein
MRPKLASICLVNYELRRGKVSKGEDGTADDADDDKKHKSDTNLGGVTFVEGAQLPRTAESSDDATSRLTAVLSAAHAAHPERFVSKPPEPPKIPTNSWINPPEEMEAIAQ